MKIMTRTMKSLIAAAMLLLPLATQAIAGSGDVPEPLQPVRFNEITFGGFWEQQVKLVTEKWLPHCVRQMQKGGEGQELLNLINAGNILTKNAAPEKYTGRRFSDAYVHNVMEAMCLALAFDAEGDKDLADAQKFLRKKIDEWIPIVLAAQMDDGYIHSFHTVNRRERYKDIGAHEFYVQGYFIESGVAHFRATNGKDKRLYNAAKKCADHLCSTFGPPPKTFFHHGHEGMGYALCRLARLVDEVEGAGKGDKYFELAKFLLDNRHKDEKLRSSYRQSHRAVVEQEHAVGHAVRATYLYTALADIAMLAGDMAYLGAANRIWDSAVNRKAYITGGVGARHGGEAFDKDYEIRNNGYCEVCAGCGFSFWGDRMHRIHKTGHYMDAFERALYNNILGALELSGEKFYYQNPLESNKPRYSWHECACCVGNIPRALLAIKDRMYSLNAKKSELYVNHFVASEGTIADVAGGPLTIKQETEYPWKGAVAITLDPGKKRKFTVRIRIPYRAESALYTAKPDVGNGFTVKVNDKTQRAKIQDGYVTIRRKWKKDDRIELALPMDAQRVYCDERAAANRGRVAIQRGPIVYSVEDVDNDQNVRKLTLKPDAELKATWNKDLLGGVMTIKSDGFMAIPNYARLNRGGWSQVWILEDSSQQGQPEQ